uniref:Uncharacterized protein n=1 Tax=Romanomermis culicivorax TaxID=13658 RepID=A0A915JLS5_ROMCU
MAAALTSRLHRGDNLKLTPDFSPKALCAVPLILLRAQEKNTNKTDVEASKLPNVVEMINDEFLFRWRSTMLHAMKRMSQNLDQSDVAKAVHWIHELDKKLGCDWLCKIGVENIDKMAIYALDPVKGIRQGDYEDLMKALCVAHRTNHDSIKIDDRVVHVLQKTLPFYERSVLLSAYREKIEQKIEACKILHLLTCSLGVKKPSNDQELIEKIIYRLNKIGDQIFERDSTLVDVLLCSRRKSESFEELDDLHYKFMTRFLRSAKIFQNLNNRTVAVGLKLFLQTALFADGNLQPDNNNAIGIVQTADYNEQEPSVAVIRGVEQQAEKILQYDQVDLCWQLLEENLEIWCEKMASNVNFLNFDEIEEIMKWVNDKKDKFNDQDFKNVHRAILCWDK